MNNFEQKESILKDSYFNAGKANHMLNYKAKIPGYKGYVPLNPGNIKGNIRPFCLSTKGENFA